jgi:hypothetical protein
MSRIESRKREFHMGQNRMIETQLGGFVKFRQFTFEQLKTEVTKERTMCTPLLRKLNDRCTCRRINTKIRNGDVNDVPCPHEEDIWDTSELLDFKKHVVQEILSSLGCLSSKQKQAMVPSPTDCHVRVERRFETQVPAAGEPSHIYVFNPTCTLGFFIRCQGMAPAPRQEKPRGRKRTCRLKLLSRADRVSEYKYPDVFLQCFFPAAILTIQLLEVTTAAGPLLTDICHIVQKYITTSTHVDITHLGNLYPPKIDLTQ